MELNELLFRGGLALALGLIIGFQRERTDSSLAGIRTFPLITFLGFFCALIEKNNGLYTVAAGLLGLSAIVVLGMIRNQDKSAVGVTTEIAAVFAYLMGAALIYLESVELVVVAGGICALLLHLKESMQRLVRAMQTKEVSAIMQFVLIAFVILPLLPDRAYDQFGVLNPRHIWLMVVLITGISLVSYSIQKFKKKESGALVAGLLGGLISSTATTVTLSRASVKNPNHLSLVTALLMASSIAFVRVLVEIIVVSPKTFYQVIGPLSLLFLSMVVLTGISYVLGRKEKQTEHFEDSSGPSELKAALVFGLLFALILYTSAYMTSISGDEGLYLVSLISGFIDVDAIILSTSQLIEVDKISGDLGWKLIMMAFISNLVFKGAIVAFMGRGRVRTQVISYFVISAMIGIGIVILG